MLHNHVIDNAETLVAPELRGLRYLEMFARIAEAAASRGLLVMMACHRLAPDAWPGKGLWHDPDGPITEREVNASWSAVSEALCPSWNVFAADLMNEPHAASWGFQRPTDWDVAAGRLGDHVASLCPRWLVMVEGVGFTPGAPGADDPAEGIWWGGNLFGAQKSPVALSDPTRLVYSPHTYVSPLSILATTLHLREGARARGYSCVLRTGGVIKRVGTPRRAWCELRGQRVHASCRTCATPRHATPASAAILPGSAGLRQHRHAPQCMHAQRGSSAASTRAPAFACRCPAPSAIGPVACPLLLTGPGRLLPAVLFVGVIPGQPRRNLGETVGLCASGHRPTTCAR